MSIFYNNFVRLCNEKGVSPTKAGTDVGVSGASVTGWSNGAKPRKANLKKLADYFGCDILDLTEDREETTSKNKKNTATSGDGTEKQIDELTEYANSLFSQLSTEKKILLIGRMQAELQNQAAPDAQKESD